MTKSIVSITKLTKRYGKKTVLHEMNLDVPHGKCVVIVGGNGAGKSTLIRMITGIEKPSSGSVTFATQQTKQFGYMPDQMNFHTELTPVETLHYYAAFLQVGDDQVNEVLKRVGLWEHRNQKVGSFSKGMAQRLNLAQALLADVDLYIFDEPTNGLDPFWVIQFKQIIQQLKDEGKTILLTSHIMRDVVEMAEEIVILFEGKIVTSGTLEAIYEQHQCSTLEEVFLSLVKPSAVS